MKPIVATSKVQAALRTCLELQAWARELARELESIRAEYRSRQRVSPKAKGELQPAVDRVDTADSVVAAIQSRSMAAAAILASTLPVEDQKAAALRSCQGKRRYVSVEAAGASARQRRKDGCKDDLRIYDCPICRGAHLTKTKLGAIARVSPVPHTALPVGV